MIYMMVLKGKASDWRYHFTFHLNIFMHFIANLIRSKYASLSSTVSHVIVTLVYKVYTVYLSFKLLNEIFSVLIKYEVHNTICFQRDIYISNSMHKQIYVNH